MKITIKGNNPITGDNIKNVIDDLEKEVEDHGIIIKNMTLYIRFLNEEGKTVDLVDEYGESIARTITINTVQTIEKPQNKSNIIDFNKKKIKRSKTKEDN